MRKTVVLLAGVGLLFPHLTLADPPIKDALRAIPKDAVGFVCVPNIQALDGKWQQALTNVGLQGMVPPPFNSPVAVLQQLLQMSEGLDLNGPVTIVQMPFENQIDFASKNAIVFPATDPEALVRSMGGQAGEGGVWNLTMFNKPGFAITAEKRLIISDTAEGVKAVAEGKGGMDANFKAKDLAAFEGLDVAIWADGERLVKIFEQQIQMFTGMFTMGAAAGGPLGAAQAESTKQQIDMVLGGIKSAVIGASLDPAGVGLRMAFDAKPGTDLARHLKVKPAKGSLLEGLPAGNFMLAAGQVFGEEELKSTRKQFEPFLKAGEEMEDIDAEQLRVLRGIVDDWVPLNRGIRATFESLPPGPGGLIGVSVLFETSDSQRWLELLGRAAETVKVLSKDEEAQEIARTMSYASEAEELGGVKVAQLKFDLSQIEDVDEDVLEQVTAVVGKEGIIVRLAPVGSDLVALGFGGGAEYMTRLIEQAGKKEAPLDSVPGIQKVAAHLPKKQLQTGYVAVDRITGFIGNVMKVVEEDEEPFPFQMPEINAPLALSVSGGDGSVQMDMFCPTELMVASKNLIMMVMGAGPAGGAAPPAKQDPGPGPGDTE